MEEIDVLNVEQAVKDLEDGKTTVDDYPLETLEEVNKILFEELRQLREENAVLIKKRETLLKNLEN